MREVDLPPTARSPEDASFAACLATILELPLDELPDLPPGEAVEGMRLARWLGGRGLGLVPIAAVEEFTWAGPWIGRVRDAESSERRAVVMYGVPSGVAWDPTGVTDAPGWKLVDGFALAPLDVALAGAPPLDAPSGSGSVEVISIASGAGAPCETPERVRALPGLGLEGDRHVSGDGTFPSGLPGSSLTLIEAEVCDSFSPPLALEEHRRNLVTRGIDLNALAGHEFRVGPVRCRGTRLCEPCRVVDGYARRPILRALVHRGGLRADILDEGEIALGDRVEAAEH